MRNAKGIFEKREEGLYPCRYPNCRDYGNTAHKQSGVVCKDHSSSLQSRGVV
jgi:hypothetical protein